MPTDCQAQPELPIRIDQFADPASMKFMFISAPKNVVTDPSGSVSLRRSLLIVISGSLRGQPDGLLPGSYR